MQNKVGIIILFIVLGLKVWSQTYWQPSIFGSYGTIGAHHPEMQYLITEPVYTLNAECFLDVGIDDNWSRTWRGAQFGFGALYADLGNKKLAGNAYSTYLFIKVPFFTTKHHEVNYSFGSGIAWLTSAFDPIDNYHQIAIGSHVNAHVNLSINYRYRISDELPLTILTGLHFNHFSNGGLFKPNLGFNLITLQAGISYEIIAKPEPIYSDNNSNLPISKFNFHIYTGVSTTQNFVYDSQIYLINNIQVFATYRISNKYSIGIGTDIIYDPSIPHFYDNTISNTLNNKLRSGIILSHQSHFGRKFLMEIQLGIYTYNPKKVDGYLYERLGFRYYFSKHLSLGIHVKAHAAVANGIETTLGWKF